MRKHLLLFVLILLPMVASAHDIAVQNADGVTIYYNYINNGTELEVTNVGAIYTNIYYTGNIIIPDEVTYMNRTRKVTSIGKRAFSDCSELTSVTIPNSVTSIGQSAFYGCISLTKVIVPDIAAWCGIEFGVGYANPLIHAHHLYSDENTEIKDLVIPNGVTSIGDYAFQSCSGLTSVTIPNSVTDIGYSAFAGCSGLTSVTIPNSVTSIGQYAFSSCSYLTSVTIGNSVTSIGDSAFSYCSSLTSITIGNSVTSIGIWAFDRCFSLTKVIVSDIAAWCGIKFSICFANPLIHAHHLYSDENTEIKDLVIPNGVTSIGDYAFESCSGLSSVTIPSSVTSIGKSAFDGWNLPVVISLIENPFTIFSSTFSQNTFYNATLYVPAGTINKYKATEGWKNFLFIEEGNPTGLNVVENTKDNNTTIYDLNGVRQNEPKKGVNIINGKKYVKK